MIKSETGTHECDGVRFCSVKAAGRNRAVHFRRSPGRAGNLVALSSTARLPGAQVDCPVGQAGAD